jgi:O-antigen ligase/tetratricopeptide (TPR) repeat protein
MTFAWRLTNEPFDLSKLALLALVVPLLGGIWLVEVALGRRLTGSHSAVVPSLFIALPVIAAWIATPYKAWGLIGEYGRYEGLVPLLLIVLLGFVTADAFNGADVTPMAWTFVTGASVVAVYSSIQAIGLDPLNMPVVDGSVISTIGHPNFLGGYLAAALCLALSLWGARGRGVLPAMVCTVVVTLALIITFSQGPWGGAVAGVAVLSGCLMGRNKPRVRLAAWALAVLVPLAMIGAVVYSQIDTTVGSAGTTRARGFWWRSAFEMWQERPLLGHGPDVYAFKNVSFRLPQDALGHDVDVTNDPHSVPLSFLANAGILGFLGWIAVAAWTIRRIPAAARGSPLHAGFAAAAIALLVNSLVSVDALVPRFALWICVGALASLSAVDLRAASRQRTPRRGTRRIAAALAAIVTVAAMGLSSVWAVRAVTADRLVLRARLAALDPPIAITHYERALEMHDVLWYRALYGTLLGRTAVDAALLDDDLEKGSGLIQRMHEVFEPLDEIPNIRALNSYAFWTYTWSVFDPPTALDAARLYERSVSLDPYAPIPRLYLAEVYLFMEEPERVVSALQPLLELYEDFPEHSRREPDARGTLALAFIDLGEFDNAQAELDRIEDLRIGLPSAGSLCQIETAQALLTVLRDGETDFFEEADVRMNLLCNLPMQETAERLRIEIVNDSA